MNSEKSCWWQEGGLCYAEPCRRDKDHLSQTLCYGKCEKYKNKRLVLATVIPNKKLIILSELNNANQNNSNQN